MDKFVTDQAEGLRKLVQRNTLQVVTVASGGGGAGKTTAVVNLALALARAGRDVLVLDQGSDGSGACAALGVAPRFDLQDVACDRASLEQAIVRGPANLSLLRTGHRAPPAVAPGSREHVIDEQHGDRALDIVLVDAAQSRESSALPLGLVASEVLVVVSATAQSITESYALVKQLNRGFGKRQFRVLVNRAASEQEARAVFANLAQAANRFLGCSLDFAGYVPTDPRIAQASELRRSVVEAFPDSGSAGRFRRLAESVLRWPRAERGDERAGQFMQRLVEEGRLCAA